MRPGPVTLLPALRVQLDATDPWRDVETLREQNSSMRWVPDRRYVVDRLRIDPGVDELALALTADAWSRTFRSQAIALSAQAAPVKTRRGLEILPERSLEEAPRTTLPLPSDREPARALRRRHRGVRGAAARVSRPER